MDLSIDVSYEKNFILNVLSYVFAKNKTKIPRLLMEIMYESSCCNVYLFPSEVRNAVDVIMKGQEKVFNFLTKECIDFYYKKRISTEKVFLEFITFHSRLALLDTFDNPEAATEAYSSMMDTVANAKQIKDFTLNEDILILESKKIAGQGLEKYTSQLIDECDKIHAEATAIVSELPREAILVTNFKKLKTKIEIGIKASGRELQHTDDAAEVEKAKNKIEIGDEACGSEFLGTKKDTEAGKDEKAQADGTSKIQITKTSESQSSKSEIIRADSKKTSEFVDVELNEEKCGSTSADVVTTGDLETVIVRRDENDLVQELLEAMEDIL